LRRVCDQRAIFLDDPAAQRGPRTDYREVGRAASGCRIRLLSVRRVI
jgi:hypothetical protein